MASTREVYLVIGGSGFLGRHIVEQLLERGDNVSVLDIVQKYHDTPFYSADICDQSQVASAIRKSGTTCIIHTASPPATMVDRNRDLFFKVNVQGTETIIAAAVETGVRKLVYTSSAGVVFDGVSNFIDIDERLPPPTQTLDPYNESKLKAEQVVLAANGKNGLLTVALRPSGIYGPGDRQVIPGMAKVFLDGQTHFQIGDNTNLFDFTYVGNLAYAHLLAADKLDTPPPASPLGVLEKVPDEPPQLTPTEKAVVGYALPPIELTIGRRRVPTSEARPLGPYVEYPPDGDKISAAFANDVWDSSRPVTRTRFDQFSEAALSLAKVHHPETSPLAVAGQVFYITNGESVYFWDMCRYIWSKLDAAFPGKRPKRNTIVFSRPVGLVLATASEWFYWLIGKKAALTRFRVTYSCVNRWHNIERARRILGYEPKVGLQQSLDETIDWWIKEYKAGTAPALYE